MNEFDLSIGAVATLGAVLTAGWLPHFHPLLVVVAYIVVMRYLLPKAGVQT